jgi:hypothetical protein
MTSSETRGRGTLPPEAAFVVQLQGDADVATGTVSGRVEHVASGRAKRFRSLPELLAFISQVLAPPDPGPSEGVT